MQFGLAFSYFLQRNGGFVNLLLITVCNFIPVVGPIVLLGYRAEVSLALLRDEELRRHPKFDFNRFGEYLARGIWPFLQTLVLTLVFILGIAVVAGVALVLAMALKLPIVGLIIGILGYLIGLTIFVMLAVPMTFHAELTKTFDFGGSFRFAKDFWLTVGGVAILSGLFYWFMAVLVIIVGLLCLFVGIYPASALNSMAAQHLVTQLYALYLDRGGKPIRQHEEDDDEDYDRRRRDKYDDEYYDDDD